MVLYSLRDKIENAYSNYTDVENFTDVDVFTNVYSVVANKQISYFHNNKTLLIVFDTTDGKPVSVSWMYPKQEDTEKSEIQESEFSPDMKYNELKSYAKELGYTGSMKKEKILEWLEKNNV